MVGGAKVYAAALPAGGTLRDARAVIAADRDDPDDPLAGVVLQRGDGGERVGTSVFRRR